jgi:hypothetical protein
VSITARTRVAKSTDAVAQLVVAGEFVALRGEGVAA